MGILLRWSRDVRMASGKPAGRRPFWSAALCLTVLLLLGETGAISHEECKECTKVGFRKVDSIDCSKCFTGLATGKRSGPSTYNDFGAFISKWIKDTRQAPSCELEDIYQAIPRRCRAKMDWIVSRAEGYE